MSRPRHLYLVGAAGGYHLQKNHNFDINKPHAGCCICGDVYQSQRDRNFRNSAELVMAGEDRLKWRLDHAKTHTAQEHLHLALSGRWCTPEAANRFAAYGIIALTDMVMSEEHESALFESSPIPSKEVQG